MAAPITAAIADDKAKVRAVLARHLDEREAMQLVGTAAYAAEAMMSVVAEHLERREESLPRNGDRQCARASSPERAPADPPAHRSRR
jgi:hypothetical protein